jgi:hypothetical protein
MYRYKFENCGCDNLDHIIEIEKIEYLTMFMESLRPDRIIRSLSFSDLTTLWNFRMEIIHEFEN